MELVQTIYVIVAFLIIYNFNNVDKYDQMFFAIHKNHLFNLNMSSL